MGRSDVIREIRDLASRLVETYTEMGFEPDDDDEYIDELIEFAHADDRLEVRDSDLDMKILRKFILECRDERRFR